VVKKLIYCSCPSCQNQIALLSTNMLVPADSRPRSYHSYKCNRNRNRCDTSVMRSIWNVPT